MILAKSLSKLVVACWAVAAVAAPAAAQIADTSAHQRPLFTWRDGVLAGGFIVATRLAQPFDKSAAVALQRPERQKRWIFQEGARIVRTIAVPGAPIIGTTMYAVGRLSHDERLAEVGLHGTEALFVGEMIATGLKLTFGRARPYADSAGPNPNDWQLFRGVRSSKYQSFPSGHTVAAFAAAAAVSTETSVWWPAATYAVIGPALYAGAAAVGLSRMYNNRHWASDVIVGAAIGTFAGIKVVRYHRTHPGNRVDKWLLNASWSPGDGRISLSALPIP